MIRTVCAWREDWVRYIRLLTRFLADMRRHPDGLDAATNGFAGLFDLARKLGTMRKISHDIWLVSPI